MSCADDGRDAQGDGDDGGFTGQADFFGDDGAGPFHILDEISAGGTWIALDGELVRVSELPAGETPVSVATARAVALSDAAAAPDLRELRDVLRRIIGYYVGRNGFKTRLTLERWSQI